MKVNVETLSPIERKLSIEVDPAQVLQELDRAYTTLSRRVQLPGFRAGKVPRRILEQRFKDQVEADVMQTLVEKAYLDAIREHNVEAVSSPTITNDRLKKDQPFTFQARVEVKPKLSPRDYKGLKLTRREAKVDDAKVQERIDQLRESMARLEPVSGRDTAQSGDFATIDYSATIDGKPFPGDTAKGVTVEVAPGELVQSKIAALEGVKVGDTKEIDYAFPADYAVDEVKGKTARFKLTLHGLKTRIIPEANDELAKEMGQGETLDALKAKIREDLEKGQKQANENEDREELFKALVAQNDFEVPKAMVDRAIDYMLEGALRMMMRSGLDPRALNLDFNRLREEMREKATLEVKGTLLTEAIAEQEKITTTDEEAEKKIEQLAADAGQPAANVKKQFRSPDQRRSLELRLREEKTIEFLKSVATYS